MKNSINPKQLFYFLSGLVFVLATLTPGTGNASTYYVSISGDDSNPGTQASSFRTINRGIRILSAGDILYVKNGEYLESVLSWKTPIPHGTSWDKPVTIAAFPGHTVTIKAPPGHAAFWLKDPTIQYLIIDGFIMDGARGAKYGVMINGSTHIRVQNSEIKNSKESGILAGGCNGCDPLLSYDTYFEFINLNVHHNGSSVKDHGFYIGSSHNLVENCDIHHNASNGGKFFNGNYAPGASASTAVNYNIFRYNTVHDNSQNASYPNDRNHIVRAAGWILASGEGHEAYGNVFYNQPQGIMVGHGAKNALVYNNILYNNSETGIWVHGQWGGSTNAKIFNNTVYGNGENGILVEQNAKNSQVKNNIAFNNGPDSSRNIWLAPGKSPGTVTANNFVLDPKFLNVSAHDFKLQPGSQAIDAGQILPEVSIDFFGVQRGQNSGYDIGAIEQEQGTDNIPPSTPVKVKIR